MDDCLQWIGQKRVIIRTDSQEKYRIFLHLSNKLFLLIEVKANPYGPLTPLLIKANLSKKVSNFLFGTKWITTTYNAKQIELLLVPDWQSHNSLTAAWKSSLKRWLKTKANYFTASNICDICKIQKVKQPQEEGTVQIVFKVSEKEYQRSFQKIRVGVPMIIFKDSEMESKHTI